MIFGFYLSFLLLSASNPVVPGWEYKQPPTDYDKIIKNLYPGMSAAEFRKGYSGIIPNHTSYNANNYDLPLSIDTNYLGRKVKTYFLVNDNLIKEVRMEYRSQSISWYRGDEEYSENIQEVQKMLDYCHSVSKDFENHLGIATVARSITSSSCVKYTLGLSENLFLEKWERKDSRASIHLYYNGEHWHDSLTADTCSPEFSMAKLQDEYNGEYEFAHDLNSDFPNPYVTMNILLNGKNDKPSFPFLCGLNVNDLGKHIPGFYRSVDLTQGYWFTNSKVGDNDMQTEILFKNDSLQSIEMEWRESNSVYHSRNELMRSSDSISHEYDDILKTFELLYKETKKKYGEPSSSDLSSKDAIASFNKNGKSKRIYASWTLKNYSVYLELCIDMQFKTDLESRLKYKMNLLPGKN